MQNLNNSIQFKRVAEEGLEQEKMMLEVYKAQLSSIIEAINFVKSNECQIVSLHEFRLLRVDIYKARAAVGRANEVIKSLEDVVRDHDREIKSLRSRMEYFVANTQRGKVLQFKGRSDEQ